MKFKIQHRNGSFTVNVPKKDNKVDYHELLKIAAKTAVKKRIDPDDLYQPDFDSKKMY